MVCPGSVDTSVGEKALSNHTTGRRGDMLRPIRCLLIRWIVGIIVRMIILRQQNISRCYPKHITDRRVNLGFACGTPLFMLAGNIETLRGN